ncbi:MAG: Gfo/Idh/MocA family oxidoreductase [Paenibacillaceae bacterium]|nr:Gfo/Idh/MocA family oxidoreductase [Paenibacillaceae bacterium]
MTTGHKRFKVIQVGCGKMARRWVAYAAAREDVEIVGLVDIHPAVAAAMAQEYGIHPARCYTDLETAIRESGANLVFDVTIPEAHKQVVLTASALGCDVFGEKPMATTMADAAEVLATVKRRGRSYAVMQNRRFTRQIRATRGLIAQGTIGKPGFATANFFLGPHFGGFRETMSSPLLLDMAIHTFDEARYLLQADPVSVYCHEFNPSHSWYDGNSSAACIFEMSDGSVFTYNGSWCAVGAPTSWHGDWRFVGGQGTLLWDGTNDPYCSVVAGNGSTGDLARVNATEEWTGREGHDGCLDEMFASLLANRPAETECADNIKSMAMVFGAIASAEQRKVIRL